MKMILKPHPNKSQNHYINVVVEHVVNGDWHIVTPYVKTEGEAIRLARITWPNEKVWNVSVCEPGMLRTITCSVCGKHEHLFYGTGAAQVSMIEVIKAANFAGWSMSPKPKCITCKTN